MNVGILYNTFICLVIGITSLVVFFLLQETRKKRVKQYSQGLDYFSLLLGLLWIFVGLRNFFAWLNLIDLDMFVFRWFSGPLTYLHLIPLFYYFGWSFFKNKKVRFLFNTLSTFMVLIVVLTFFVYGFSLGKMTSWGTDPEPNSLTNKLFIFCLFLPVFLLMIIEFIRRLRNWRRTKDPIERQLFGFSLGFLIYAIMGIFDALGIIEGWLVLLVRIGIMFAPLTFYFFTSLGFEE